MTRTLDITPGPAATTPPPERPGARRRIVLFLLVLAVVTAAITGLALAGSPRTVLPPVKGRAPGSPLALARYDARAFLTRYMDPDGRVVRRDQGGDTVSEGQAYAMLLAVAVGDRRAFSLAWKWDADNLETPAHLSAYHWQSGSVVDKDPASDADLDMAWALVLAAKRFGDPAYRTDGLQIAAAVLSSEVVTVAGKPELVAGTWARTAPAVVDPSYFSPEAMASLAAASGDQRWKSLERDADAVVVALDRGPTALQLPPDWATLAPTGKVSPAGAPSQHTAPSYGLDAQRIPVWYSASCATSERAISAATWPILQSAASGGARLAYSLTGSARASLKNPLGDVAAAAAADASGDRAAAARLLDRADAQAATYHTYYGDAWVALGRVLLDTTWLSACPPSPAKS